MSFYKRCPACEAGVGPGGEPCEVCDGHGGWWVVVDGSGGLSVRIVPGDADDRPPELDDSED